MIKIKSINGPSAEQWLSVINGVRSPLKSYDRSDSWICKEFAIDTKCTYCRDQCKSLLDGSVFNLGPNDYNLLKRLDKQPEERKYKRQLNYVFVITAPLYWWKQFDTYKIGVTQNSESTMHTLLKSPITPNCFSIENVDELVIEESFGIYCRILEDLRLSAVNETDYQKQKNKFTALVQLLPESYNQTRTVSIPLSQLENIYRQRKHHKLFEWIEFINETVNSIEYPELMVGFDEYIKLLDKNSSSNYKRVLLINDEISLDEYLEKVK